MNCFVVRLAIISSVLMFHGCATQQQQCQPKITMAKSEAEKEWAADAKKTGNVVDGVVTTACTVGSFLTPLRGPVASGVCRAGGKAAAVAVTPTAIPTEELSRRMKEKVDPTCRAYL
jgi:hypothetical protein